MSCFDYLNSLADLTVGYLGAPMEKNQKWQWLLVRTERGQELLDLVKDELEYSLEQRSGDASEAVKMNSMRSIEQMKAEQEGQDLGSGSRMPMWGGKLLTLMMKLKGPKGLEFARYSIDFHLIRNYYFLKLFYPEKLSIVPPHVLEILREYDIEA
jgi:coenzyme F420 hydrogenase subunit beta